MKCIVPIAGPDLWSPEFGLRPLVDVDGQPMLEWVLSSRPWSLQLQPSDYIFVVRAVRGVNDLISYLGECWPGSRVLSLPDLTDGAMLTAMAGVTLCKDDEVLVVDLADIRFDACEPFAQFEKNSELGAIVPTFESLETIYSYLNTSNGYASEAREKVVISNQASAGVYVFKNRRTFIQAAAHSLSHHELRYNNLYYVCPMVNGVIDMGLKVQTPKTSAVIPVGKIFHRHS